MIDLIGVGFLEKFSNNARESLSALGVSSFSFDDLVVFTAKADTRPRLLNSSKRLGRKLVEKQQRLEAVLAHGGFLPGAPNTSFESEQEVQAIISRNTDYIRGWLEKVEHFRQFQITVSWTESEMLAALKSSVNSRARDDIAFSGNKRDAARNLQSIAKDLCDQKGSTIVDRLVADNIQLLELPKDEPPAILNIACMIERNRLEQFENTLEEIDSVNNGAFLIKMIGPLPPVSFAAITTEEISTAEITSAMKTLHVETLSSPDRLKEAYRAYMKRAHPDAGGDEEAARVGADAHKLLKALTDQGFSHQNTGKEKVLLCRIEGTEAA